MDNKLHAVAAGLRSTPSAILGDGFDLTLCLKRTPNNATFDVEVALLACTPSLSQYGGLGTCPKKYFEIGR